MFKKIVNKNMFLFNYDRIFVLVVDILQFTETLPFVVMV